jgi:glycosyltransferase involved in cell wall biosynthesis
MNLLFCIKAMNNPGGGAERVLSDIANSLVKRGHSVRVLTFEKPGGKSFYPLAPEIERVDVAIGDTVNSARFMETQRRILGIRRALKKLKPDVAIGFMHSAFLPLGFAAAGTGIPVIASEHIVPHHYRTRPLEAVLLRTAPYLVRSITCTSEAVRQEYPAALRAKMIPIPNPVTVSPKGTADVAGGMNGKKLLLTVGRLEKQKDHETLIRAFAALHERAPDWQLKIVGDGSLRPRLERLIAGLGIANRVELAGSIPNISDEYLAAQLFVLPSRYESFGLTTVEAMSHGLPAVGFADCLGTRDLIKPGLNGELVAVGRDRVRSLAETLLPLMLNADKRGALAHNARLIKDEYTLDAVIQLWENLIQDAATGGKR